MDMQSPQHPPIQAQPAPDMPAPASANPPASASANPLPAAPPAAARTIHTPPSRQRRQGSGSGSRSRSRSPLDGIQHPNPFDTLRGGDDDTSDDRSASRTASRTITQTTDGDSAANYERANPHDINDLISRMNPQDRAQLLASLRVGANEHPLHPAQLPPAEQHPELEDLRQQLHSDPSPAATPVAATGASAEASTRDKTTPSATAGAPLGAQQQPEQDSAEGSQPGNPAAPADDTSTRTQGSTPA